MPACEVTEVHNYTFDEIERILMKLSRCSIVGRFGEFGEQTVEWNTGNQTARVLTKHTSES